MTNLTINNLPKKFLPHLLGAAPSTTPIKEEIDKIFERGTLNIANTKCPHVMNANKWQIKGQKGVLTDDSNLYRIRKAERIRNYINKDPKLKDEFIVPKKYLYWNESQKKFFVISETVELSSDVVKPSSEMRDKYIQYAYSSGQCKALAQGNRERAITPRQAHALAEMAFKFKYNDLHYNNMYFAKDGKIAILDTEPVKRQTIKKLKHFTYFPSWLWDLSSLPTQQGLSGTAKLKMQCSDPKAIAEIQKVERKYVLQDIAKTTIKVAAAIFVIYNLPAAAALLPIAGAFQIVMKMTLITFISIRSLTSLYETYSVKHLWDVSYKGKTGLDIIEFYEKMGNL